jgi:hypothetical protein
MTTSSNDRCWCGNSLHYKDKEFEQEVRHIVERFGEYIVIEQNGHKYLVQRHYIALHGIPSKDLSKIGFQEVDDANGRI